MSHNHCHNGCHDHDHSSSEELGIQYNLYEKIDKENLECLNESVEGAGKTVFKPWDKRLDTVHHHEVAFQCFSMTKSSNELWSYALTIGQNTQLRAKPVICRYVESDADEELLFNIPFTGNVKLKGIKVASENSDAHPSKLRLFKNKPNMTFDDVTMEPDQVFELHRDTEGILEYAPKIVTFSSVTHLTMHFPSNFGADTTKIFYIGLKGEWAPGHKHGVTICTYEARPMLDDHKLKHLDSVSKDIE